MPQIKVIFTITTAYLEMKAGFKISELMVQTSGVAAT